MNDLKILCSFCNAVWTAEMIEELEDNGSGCDSCGYGSGVTGEITINCSNCNRVVYKKEIDTR